jgi:hypothetical protein
MKIIYKHWTITEEKFLKENRKLKTGREMAVLLNRSLSSVHGRINKLELKKHRKWTQDEKDYLFENYPKLGGNKLAGKMGRTENSIKEMARVLKVKRNFSLK